MSFITETNIRQTFDNELLQLLPLMDGSENSIAWPNMKFTPKSNKAYLKPILMPAENGQASLGYPCHVRLNGVYQISIYEPKNSGLSQGEKWGDVILSAFPLGRSLDCCGNNLIITRAYRGTLLEEDNRAITPISLVYYCYALQEAVAN